MAELTAEQIKVLEEKAAKADALQAENDALKESLDNSVQKSPKVNGTFKVKGNKKYKFKDGAVNTRLSNGQMVPTEMLMKLANGESVEPADLSTYPALKQIAEDDGSAKGSVAKDYLAHLVDIGYGLIE